MIASEPNAKEKGVSPVARSLVVRYAHRHLGSSSGHFPFFVGEGFLEAVEDRLVGCFDLPIVLRISRRGHVLLDAIFLEEIRQIFAVRIAGYCW